MTATTPHGGLLDRPARPGLGQRILAIEGLPILLVFVVVLAALMILTPNNAFLSSRTYLSILINNQYLFVCALGLTLVIAAGEIDLAFPSIITLTSIIFAAFYRIDIVGWMAWYGAADMSPEALVATQAWSAWIGLIAAIGAGAMAGAVAGVLVARVGIPSIIATLALGFVWRGVAVFLAGGKQYSLRDFNDTTLWEITSGRVLTGLFDTGVVLQKPIGIPIQFLIVLAIAVALWFILNRHRFGEAVLFVGDNANVAKVLGIDVKRTRMRLFILMGALAGLAGVFLTSETENFTATQGQGALLIVIAAVFIGGTSIFGGSGTIVGTYIGLLIVLVLQTGMTALGLGGDVADMLIGAVFIVAVVLHMVVERPERLKGLGLGWGR